MFLKVAACSSFVSTLCLVASAEGFSSLGIYYAPVHLVSYCSSWGKKESQCRL